VCACVCVLFCFLCVCDLSTVMQFFKRTQHTHTRSHTHTHTHTHIHTYIHTHRWAVASLTGVGYGDIVPQTPFGKFFAAVSSFLGIGLLSICAGTHTRTHIHTHTHTNTRTHMHARTNTRTHNPHTCSALN